MQNHIREKMRLVINTLILIVFFGIQNSYSFESKANQAVLLDYESGEILYSKNADKKVFPSSMTKIMTAYLIFEDLESGKLRTTDRIEITNDAWKQVGSRMFLNIGSKVSVDELLKGLIVQSGNDAAYALAEGSAGSVDEFVEKMNDKAKELGLKNTKFTNPIGFSDDGHYMSVKDTAILSEKLIERFPHYYIKYFSMPEFKYNNILQQNRNQLLGKYEGVDGIKTGHTEAGGYSLAVSAFKDNRRLISVVNGSTSEFERAEESRKLLDYGFLTLTRYKLYEKGEPIEQVPVLYGKQKYVNAVSKTTIYATAKNRNQISTKINLKQNLKAPVAEGDKIGEISVKTEADERTFDLYAANSVEEVNIFKKILLKIYYFFKNIF